jgi:hypothetical protein
MVTVRHTEAIWVKNHLYPILLFCYSYYFYQYYEWNKTHINITKNDDLKNLLSQALHLLEDISKRLDFH